MILGILAGGSAVSALCCVALLTPQYPFVNVYDSQTSPKSLSTFGGFWFTSVSPYEGRHVRTGNHNLVRHAASIAKTRLTVMSINFWVRLPTSHA